MSKTKKVLAAATRASNKQFAEATKAQKRVIVAQDAIAQVRLKHFQPQSGVYIEANTCSLQKLHKLINDPKLLNEKNHCVGCGLGGLFMSLMQRTPEKSLSKFRRQVDTLGVFCPEHGDSPSDSPLHDIFDDEQLELIEDVFEGGWNEYDQWHEGPYVNDTNRFVAIMMNIVKNRGRFKPEQAPPAKPYSLELTTKKKV